MAEHRWAVNAATNEFLYGGVAPYDCVPGLSPNQIRVVTDRQPNPQLERYSGDPASPIEAKPAAEIAADELARQWRLIRGTRDERLSSCDWIGVTDTQLSGAAMTAWETYRQALRDVPQENADVNDITWPVAPS